MDNTKLIQALREMHARHPEGDAAICGFAANALESAAKREEELVKGMEGLSSELLRAHAADSHAEAVRDHFTDAEIDAAVEDAERRTERELGLDR